MRQAAPFDLKKRARRPPTRCLNCVPMADLNERDAQEPALAHLWPRHAERPAICTDGKFRLFRLTGGQTSVHTTAAPHVLVAWNGVVTVRWVQGRVTAQAILVAPGVPHTIDGEGGLFHLLTLGDYLAHPARHGPPVQPLDARALHAFADYYRAVAADDGRALADRLRLPPVRLSSPIEAVIARMRADPMHRVGQHEAAALARMERTALLKRFRRETGLTFRAYKNWVGVVAAVHGIVQGRSAAQAAMDAGFADLAHFSRQCRAVTGYSPRQGFQYLDRATDQAQR